MTLVLIVSMGYVLIALIGLWAYLKLKNRRKRYGKQTGDVLISWGDREQSRFTD
jgi:hypothetical protein